LTSKLELAGFKSHEDIYPCRFGSDKVICRAYMCETLFFAPANILLKKWF